MDIKVQSENTTIFYHSKLGLHDLTSLMGYLFGRNHITHWEVLEYISSEIYRERNEEQYNIEKNYLLGDLS